MPRSIGQYTEGIKLKKDGQSNASLEENMNSRLNTSQCQHKSVTKELAKGKNQTNTMPLPAKEGLSNINTQIEPSFMDTENLTSHVSDMHVEKVHTIILFHLCFVRYDINKTHCRIIGKLAMPRNLLCLFFQKCAIMSDAKCSVTCKEIHHVESIDKTNDIAGNKATSSLQLKAPIAGFRDMTEDNESSSNTCQELSVLNGIQQMPCQILR